MGNLLKTGSAWLAATMVQSASSPVSYTRGDIAGDIVVNATIGRTQFDVDNGDGATIRTEVRDYLVPASELVDPDDGSPVIPKPGDRFTEGTADAPLVYEVMDLGSAPCWRWSDRYFTRRRIHTKFVGNGST